MWLAGRQRPDFRTLNRFRSQRMKDVLETVFTAVLQFLADENYVSLEHYFVDGTKIEANANRYTFVWGKAVSKHKLKLQEKVHTLFASIEAAEEEEAAHVSTIADSPLGSDIFFVSLGSYNRNSPYTPYSPSGNCLTSDFMSLPIGGKVISCSMPIPTANRSIYLCCYLI